MHRRTRRVLTLVKRHTRQLGAGLVVKIETRTVVSIDRKPDARTGYFTRQLTAVYKAERPLLSAFACVRSIVRGWSAN